MIQLLALDDLLNNYLKSRAT